MPEGPHTDKHTEVTQRILDLLTQNKTELGITDLYYGGPQDLAPNYPCVFVESGPKTRIRSSTQRFSVLFTVLILLQHGRVDQLSEQNKAEVEQLVERIEDFIHQDYTLENLIMFGFITRVEPGITTYEGVKIRASRITWQGEARRNFF